uniref:coiled-coil domain-containing protein 158 isoform X1 n=3 Tax=Halichoerus grypus TaxID=9711 RepID=UPI0016590521|nr:coiled-coil domain-containing protein 158 isoform X1 [Halichoerus grypus]XP_035953720.1 coiled-coil domain-containing protein 158 isoform X1 [Halichoerus grypus]XP_035953721.1 coiled-coil domain-containing protein 158 isoform X1 [Halichoerus grypus]XP_035953722.1 coiled-coil domain-containing protein 158 isoform X1 [Halichoerus grypus]XP_035953723.1 coiled-coil domain-containing protein 158 isoform X1 [Halichoerus grypus]
MEQKAGESNNDLLSSSGVTSNGGSSSPFFMSSIRGTIIENTSSAGTLTQIPFFPKYEVELDSPRKVIPYPGKEHIERVLEEYSHQVKDLQRRLNESNELHEKQKFYLRQSVIDLQTKLQEMQMERDAMADIRRRESQSQEDLRNQLQNTVHELEAAKCLKEDMLKDSNAQIEQLRKMMLGHEGVLQEIRSILADFEEASGKKIYEHENVSTLHFRNMGSAISKILRELDTEISYLKGRIFPVEDQLEALKSESQNKIELLLQQHQDRIEQLISEHEIEITGLTEKASSARSQANSIQSQLEIIQEQARNQNSMYMRQLSDLESTVSQLRSELREAKRMYEDKIEELEKQLVLANSELTEARTERDQFSQESGNLDDQLQKLLADLHKREKELSLEKEQNKRLWDRDTGNSITIDHLRRELDDRNMEVQRLEALLKAMKSECQGQMERQMAAIQGKNESLEKVSSLTAQLESTKEMLRKVVEELTAKKMTLESSERTVSDLTASLQEKERAIEATNSEITKLRSRVDLKLQELQHLKTEGDHLRNVQTECEALRLQMAEKDKVIEILRQQIENMTQLVGQHGRTAGAMQVEKAQLEKEINDRRLELQEFKILKDKKDAKIRELEARVSDLELEKVKLVNAGSERLRAVKDIKQERDQLLNEVKTSRSELNSLTEDYEVLKRNFRNKTEEMEATTNKLKMQLKSAQSELEQTRNTLKSMEGSDGHAMKVAMGMQKQITAKRGQIDALQSKIQFLEEAMTNANKEKHFLKEEKNKLSQELSTVATEKNKMAGELEVLRSQERRLKEKVANMEVALDKASLQFAECQDIIQRQEQESVRLKLQHTLDVKELQGPGYTSNTSVKPRLLQPSSAVRSHSNVPSSQSTASFLSHHSMKPNILKEDPTRDLKQLLQELRSVINEEPAVPLGKPEEEGRTPSLGVSYVAVSNNSLRDSTEGSKSSDTLSREPVTLHAGDLEDPSSCFTFPSTASPSVKNSASRSFHSSPKKSPVHSLLTSSVEDSVGSTSQYRSTKPVHSPDPVKVSANRNNRKNMQEASEQTGKLANSGRRFTDEEPRYCVHFREIFLAQKSTHLPFRLSLLSIEPLKRIWNKQFRNLSQNMKVLAMSNP